MSRRLFFGVYIAVALIACSSVEFAVADTPSWFEVQRIDGSTPEVSPSHLAYISGGLSDKGAFYLNPSEPKLVFQLTLPSLVPVQWAVAFTTIQQGETPPALSIMVGEDARTSVTPTNSSEIRWDISRENLRAGTNLITIQLQNAAQFTSGDTLPQVQISSVSIQLQQPLPQSGVTPFNAPITISSKDGVLNVDLYAKFAQTKVTGTNAPDSTIWTRAYALAEKAAVIIPSATLYYNPGDLVNITLITLLNPDSNPALAKFENLQAAGLDHDEVLAADHLKHEINIPHNLNNTNIHMHGLHVDPSKDDVTIVVTPDDPEDAPGGQGTYDAPTSPTPTTMGLNEGSVSDQSVKEKLWKYQYRIPSNHLPGTHWYHPYKHGSTAAQVENGLAGAMVIRENQRNAVVPYPGTEGSVLHSAGNVATQTQYNRDIWEKNNDRILVIQEIANYGFQKGNATGPTKVDTTDTTAGKEDTDITVNGQFQPTLTLRPGQLERWRFVHAGANHKAFSQLPGTIRRSRGARLAASLMTRAPYRAGKRLREFQPLRS